MKHVQINQDLIDESNANIVDYETFIFPNIQI